ncbi:formin-3-like [Musa acuminata AAA Group]|uniref:formin-3-like n=1 Tax=Musa acuminata AAA Group TaxID=214697 RepID=UPI0031E3B2C2
MAYRRKQPVARVSTYDDSRSTSAGGEDASSTSSTPGSLAARAIRASAAHRDVSSLSSAYGESAVSSPRRESHPLRSAPSPQQDSASYEYTSMKSLNESKYGFWGTLARKAKTFIDNDETSNQFQGIDKNPHQTVDRSTGGQPEIFQKTETTHKRSDAIGSSINYISGTIKNALEEGLTIVESKTADIIHETRKLNIRRKGNAANVQSQAAENLGQRYTSQIQTDYETQLKASRDVANAMAAKAKLLLRELKTVKADFAFAKERCAQLEEENKVLRESHDKGDNPEDDDLIRLQLETLLAEKARLAHENSVYARENRFLREIVEYHQLTMQDVVYVDEGIEEVTEVYMTPNAPSTPSFAASEANTVLVPTPLTPTHTTNSPTSVHPPSLSPPSIIIPEDCPIVPIPPMPTPLSDPLKSAPPPPSAAGAGY